jgi:hypothetical protein
MGQCLDPTVSSSAEHRKGYRCAARDEAAAVQVFLRQGPEDPDWLFRQCCRIAKALDGHVALAQVYGLDDGQLKQLAIVAPFIKANFDPDQPRDTQGRWRGAKPISRRPLRGRSAKACALGGVIIF